MPMTKQYTSERILKYSDLGKVDYAEAWTLQQNLYDLRLKGKIKDTLLLLEHPHTYTIGKAGNDSNIVADTDFIDRNEIGIFKVDRGGDVTYHGPGQLVGYIIMDLNDWKKDVNLFLRSIEKTIIDVCSDYGLNATRKEKYTGVWIEERKICAIGVKVSRWISMHGFALNVNTNLDFFKGIIPCGIKDKEVTSLEREVTRELDIKEVKKKVFKYFAKEFGYSRYEKIDAEDIFKTNQTKETVYGK